MEEKNGKETNRPANEKIYRQGFRKAMNLVYKNYDGNGNSGGKVKLKRILKHVMGKDSSIPWTDAEIENFFETLPYQERKEQPCNPPTACDDGDNGCVRCPDLWEA